MKRLLTVLVILMLVSSVMPIVAEGGPELVGIRLDAPTYAKHGPYWVGTMEFTISDPNRPLPVTVWYPALNPKGLTEAVTYTYDPGPSIDPFTVKGQAIEQAEANLANGPYPLVIFSHGNVGFRYFSAYLTEHLASHGFVVMSVDHVGNTIGYANDPELAGKDSAGWAESTTMAITYRPADIQRTIDYATVLTAKEGPLAGLIDMEHIGVTGHSYGGFTALASAGGRIDFAPLQTWCKENADNNAVTAGLGYILTCVLVVPAEDRIKEALGVKVGAGELWPAFNVKGVDAIVPLAPFGSIFPPSGVQAITIPTLIMVGSGDALLPVDLNSIRVYENLSSDQKSLVVFDQAGHGIFSNKADEWMTKNGWFDYTTDSIWDMDRVHDLTNHLATAFLLDVLKGDKEAHKALLPEAVTFPGVEYKTTLK